MVRSILPNEARNDAWHSDVSCMERPASVSVLHAVDVKLAPGYGDTIWANMHRAWAALDNRMRLLLVNMSALHSTRHFERDGALETLSRTARNWHPVVRVHPTSCKEALYLSEHFIETFSSMSEAGSRRLLDYLISRSTVPENTYRHRWSPGDVVIWVPLSTTPTHPHHPPTHPRPPTHILTTHPHHPPHHPLTLTAHAPSPLQRTTELPCTMQCSTIRRM